MLEFSGVARKDGGLPDKLKIEHYAVVSLPTGAVVDKIVVDPEAVGETIAKVVRKSGTRTRRAALAVGGPSTITKYINMPVGLTERQMEQQIEIEAEQHIPFPIEEVSIDFEVLGPKPNNPETLNVLLVAARTDIVDVKVDAVESGGVEAVVVDLAIFALENACEFLNHQLLPGIDAKSKNKSKDKDKTKAKAKGKDKGKGKEKAKAQEPTISQRVVVVDAGATTTSITVLENGHPIYTRDQQFGGNLLTEEIMERYGLSYEKAGLAKKTGEFPPGTNYADDLLKPFMLEMAQQVNRGIQLFQSVKAGQQMQQIIFAGGCAAIKDIDRVVQAETGIPTVIADPFGSIAISPRAMPERVRRDAPALLIAAGLALRGFD